MSWIEPRIAPEIHSRFPRASAMAWSLNDVVKLDGPRFLEEATIAQQRPEHAGPAAGEGDDGLCVLGALGSFLEVVVAVGSVADDAGLG